jgi:glutathione S-transferase
VKLYTFPHLPNPRRVAIFLAEKGIDVPVVIVNMREGEHRKSEFLRINPRGKVPVLELDDGFCLTESLAICRYLEALFPKRPYLFGESPRRIGEIEMLNRILELELYNQLVISWRNGPLFRRYYPDTQQIAGAKEQSDAAARAFYREFDAQLQGRRYVAGEAFSMADIIAVTSIDFATGLLDLRPDDDLQNLWRWHSLVHERPSVRPAE